MQLRDLQSQFRIELIKEQETDLQNLIEQRGFLAKQRIGIYRNNINSTLIETLANIYPVSYAMVGQDFFRQMARSYVKCHSPVTGDLSNYGEHFSSFMMSVPSLENLPYLPDLAKIDWACHLSFHAASLPMLDISCLADFSPDHHEHLLMSLHPAVHAIGSDYPIFDIWDFATASHERQSVPDIHSGKQHVLIYRKNNSVSVAKIDSGLFDMISLISDQQTLGTLIPALLKANPEYNLEAGLNRLFSYGAISSITIRNH